MSAIRINPKTVWSDEGFPFHQAVVEPEGHRVHITGQVAWDVENKVVGLGDAEMQTDYAIDNIARILAELGGTLDDIVSLTMYFVRDQDLAPIQQVRRQRFRRAFGPASTGVKVAALVDPDLLVELTVVAVIPAARFRVPAA